MDFTGITKVGIIGTGIAGLATAKTLLAEGFDCTLFERHSTLGGVWADGYLNFGAQVQKELYEFPDWPLPADTPSFTPGPLVHQYLTDYANHFGVTSHIKWNCLVTDLVQRTDASPGWDIAYDDEGGSQTQSFDLVVACVGLYSNVPYMPTFPDQDRFQGDILHISGLKSADQLRGKRVAVLGYGKSATDAAVESAAVASQTSLIFRQSHWPIPTHLAGIIPFKWALLNRLNSTLIPLYQRPSALERVVHTWGKPLVWLYWRLVEGLFIVQCRLGSRFGTRPSLVPRLPIEIDAFGESTMLPRSELYRLIRRGAIDPYRAEIETYTPTGVTLSTGEHLDVDMMIYGTGWRTDYGFLPESVRTRLQIEDDGLYLYRHMLHPNVPRLMFIGHVSTISSLLTYPLQARWLAELLKGRHALPSTDDMRREIAAMQAWKRSWMSYSHARGSRLLVHMLHYHDELVGDIGGNPLRKTGVLAPLMEVIAPYEPRDYRSIVAGTEG